MGLTVHSGRPQWTFMGALDLGLELDLEWGVGLGLGGGLGRRFSLLLLLHEDLVVQKLQLSWIQFGFSQHRRWFFVDQHLINVFIRATGRITLFFLLILRQFEVHTQTDPGTGA